MRSGFTTWYVFKDKKYKSFSIPDCVTYPRVGETVSESGNDFIVYKVHVEPSEGFVHVHLVEDEVGE